MAFVNYNNREITAKVVYYGPALSGKTSCLKYIYDNKVLKTKSKLITLDTDGDRTLFFDFLPIEIGKVGNYNIKIQLYTVPGQVAYNTTRKMVLQGADGIVFVADSQKIMKKTNIESITNLKKNLISNNLVFSEIPIIFQYNKRDLTDIIPIQELNESINKTNKPYFPTIATAGDNVVEGLHAILKTVLVYLKSRLSIFQKDRTVMFSREEITTPSDEENPKSDDHETLFSDEDDANEKTSAEEDSQNEELFELSLPVEEKVAEPVEKNVTEVIKKGEIPSEEKSGDIFELTDYNVGDKVTPEESEDQMPIRDDDFFFNNESEEPPEKIKNSELKKKSKVEKISGEELIKKINLPVEIVFPKDKDEIQIDLNIKLTLKKEK